MQNFDLPKKVNGDRFHYSEAIAVVFTQRLYWSDKYASENSARYAKPDPGSWLAFNPAVLINLTADS